jgi:predicted CopG family antitoxin
MTKHVVLAEDVISQLNELKAANNASYSEVIREILTYLPDTTERNIMKINEYFYGIEKITPELREALEMMRVITIRYYKLPISVKNNVNGVINNTLEDVIKLITVRE